MNRQSLRRPVDGCGGARRRAQQVRTYSPISCLARHVSHKIFSSMRYVRKRSYFSLLLACRTIRRIRWKLLWVPCCGFCPCQRYCEQVRLVHLTVLAVPVPQILEEIVALVAGEVVCNARTGVRRQHGWTCTCREADRGWSGTTDPGEDC